MVLDLLTARLDRYKVRYGSLPAALPVTLDEWVEISEYLCCIKALASGRARLEVLKDFRGVPLKLVAAVQDLPDGAVAVWT